MLNIGVLVSGGGTNLQKLIDAQNAGEIKNGCLRVVICLLYTSDAADD